MQAIDPGFFSLTHEPLTLQATEARLTRIYDAARKGLKGDALAFAAGMKPSDYRRLAQMDPLVELAEQKGAADGEHAMASVLYDAAAQGDAKAALDHLKHTRGWVAKQQINVDIEQRISVTDALERAQQRVIEGMYVVQNDAIPAEAEGAPTPTGSLTTGLERQADDCATTNTSAP